MIFSPYHRVGNLLVALLLNTTFLHLEFYQAEAADTDIVINEIMYHPGDTNTGDEYIELYNRGATPVNLSGWVLEGAVNFIFPPNTTLSPHAYLVVCQYEPNAINFYNIPDTITIGNYSGKLDNAGEQIILKNDDSPRIIIDSVNYDDAAPWPTEPDGAGVSLELFSPNSDNSLVQSWGIGQLYSPGAVNNPAAPDSGDIVITEIMYQPLKKRFMENLDPRHGGYWWEDGDDPLGEYIELFNRGSQTIDLAGWAILHSIYYTFPAGNPKTIMNPGDYLVICFDAVSIAENYGITNTIGNFTGSLSNDGERVTLINPTGMVMDTVRYSDESPWPIGPDQEGQSLECMDPWTDNDRPDNWRATRVPEPNLPELIWEPDVPQWTYYETTCTASSNTIYFYLNGAGEWLLDDVRVYAVSDPATNIMENGSFEPDDSGWIKTGNHSGTYRTNTDFHNGSGCERIVSTGTGGSSTNSLNRTITGMTAGQTYKLSCWVKYVSGGTSLTFRLSGGGCFTTAQPSSGGGELHPCQSSLVYFVGTEIFVTRGTPGAANTVSSSGLPPMASNLAHSPVKPRSSEQVKITAQISGDETISSVMLDYEVFTAPYNEATESAAIPMNDQGLNGDTFAYDGIYTAQIPAKSSQTLVRYRVTVTDSSARSWTWPDEAEPNPNKAYFVYDGEADTKLDACFMIMTQENLDWLQETVNMYRNDPWNPAFKQYAQAAVVIDGIVYDNIKTRYRADRVDAQKHAYKLKFNKGEYFNDFSTLDTDFQWPIAQDVASNMFTLVGQMNIALVPIRFYLNGDFAGILVLQESPNSAWLKKMGLDGDSEIYKSKSSDGCCSGFLPCGCIPNVCWCSIGSSCTSNLGYYSDLSYYPRMYIKRSDALGSFQSLQDFTRDLQSANTTWLQTYTEVDNWIYKSVIQSLNGHCDWHAKNYYVVRSPDPGGKWDMFYFDYDMFWGCRMFGSCYGTTIDPKCSGTAFNGRVYANPDLNNRFLLILKDVAENILTEQAVCDMLDQAFTDTAADRLEELQTVNGAAVTTDARLADLKQFFIDRRNYILNTYLPAQNITPPANAHPLISLNEPNVITSSEIQISWTWSDAEGNPSTVDLFWTDLGFNHFVPIPGAENLPAGLGGQGEFTWTTDIPDMTKHHIYIHAAIKDGNGVLVGRSTSGFAIPIEPPPIPGDINKDDSVDMTDLILFAAAWLEPPEPIDTGEMLTWDVAADYSLVNNPNGPWSYRDSSSWLLMQAPNGTAGGGLPGWAGPGGLPSFFHGPWNFAAADEMVSHGPLMIRWTSPLLGSIQISGSGKAPDWELSRLMHWQWRKNNVVLTEGNFPPNYSVVDFSTGTNGSGALVQSVLPGENIDFVCTGSGPNPTDTFFSFKFEIEQLSGQITELAPPEIDFIPDNKINLLDFAVLAEHWMETTQ